MVIFSLIETKQLYNKIIKNGFIPITHNEKILFKKLNIHIPKKKRKKKYKKNDKVLVFFTLTIQQCINLKIDYSNKKIINNTITHFIEGIIIKYINNKKIKVYFPIDGTKEIVPINTIKKI